MVKPGDLVNAKLDVVMCRVTTPPAITMLREQGMDSVFDLKRSW